MDLIKALRNGGWLRSGDKNRAVPDRFLVAFSFASEDRVFVERLARATEAALGISTVFYDDWFEHLIAGDQGQTVLEEIYRDRSVLAVPCISAQYHHKRWPKTERDAMRSRTIGGAQVYSQREDLSVMSLLVGDEAAMDKEPSGAIVPDVRHRTIEKTVNLIVSRLCLLEPDFRLPQDLEDEKPVRLNRLVALGSMCVVVAIVTVLVSSGAAIGFF